MSIRQHPALAAGALRPFSTEGESIGAGTSLVMDAGDRQRESIDGSSWQLTTQAVPHAVHT